MQSPITTCTDATCTPKIQLFGSFRLTVHGSPVPLTLGVERLLAVLALEERMSRPRLAATFWPMATRRQGQTNLRKIVWRLNSAVPDHVLIMEVGRDLQLRPAVVTDVGVLVAAAHQNLRPHRDGTQRPAGGLASLEKLVQPHAVDLLPDWDDEWLEADRERLRQLRLHLLEEWAARLTDDGEYCLALEVALCAVRTDVLRESAHRAVINVHRAEGNIGEARRAFANCSAVLIREVGIPPSPATAAMVP